MQNQQLRTRLPEVTAQGLGGGITDRRLQLRLDFEIGPGLQVHATLRLECHPEHRVLGRNRLGGGVAMSYQNMNR